MSQATYLIFLLIFALNLISTRADIDDLKTITLKDITSGKFPLRGFNGVWTSRKQFVYMTEEGLVEYDLEFETKTVLLKQEVLSKWNVASVTPSPSKYRYLIKYNQTRLYLNRQLARYVVYDVRTGEEFDLNGRQEIAYCVWSPARDELAYSSDGGVSLVTYFDGENSAEPFKVQHIDFRKDALGRIVMGQGDWIYYETIFKKVTGLWFSSRLGNYLAFIVLDTTGVPEYSFMTYGDPTEKGPKYPETVTFKMPQAGQKIPEVELVVANRENFIGSMIRLKPPAELGPEAILASVGWFDDDHVAPMWMNRAQTRGIVQSCPVDKAGPCSELISITEPTGWVTPDTVTCTQYPTSRQRCLINVNGLLYERDIESGVTYSITPKEMTVFENYGLDEMRQHLFVLGTGYGFDNVTDPASRHVYRITADGDIECITCNLENPEANLCTYASASFSTDRSYFAVTCSGPDPAFVKIFSNNAAQVTPMMTWELNNETREKLREYKTTPKMTLRVPLQASNFTAMVKLYLPPCLNPESPKKYPMIVTASGGPNEIRVLESFSINDKDYLAQSLGVIFCIIDTRGAGSQGFKHLFEIKNKLGQVDVEDTLEVMRHLIENYKFIDRHRIGIWGRRYAGYAAAMTLAKDQDGIFQGGISISPMSSFHYHTAIYTDRFLGLPEEGNYEGSDLNQYAERFLGKKYLLVHGTASEQITFMHSMMWAKSLQRAGVLFDQQFYPDDGISLQSGVRHLFELMDDFWIKTLRITQWDALCQK